MSKNLSLEPGEQVVVSTVAHPTKLLKPAIRLVVVVFIHAFVQRMLQVRWRPVEAPLTTIHSFLSVSVSLLLVLIVFFGVIRPCIRWAFTRFVLTDRRLMLVGAAAPRRGVRIPLAWLLRVEAEVGRGPLGMAGIGTLTADFGQAGILRLNHAPKVEEFAKLIQQTTSQHVHGSLHQRQENIAGYGG